jgi:hypothetical protein
MKQRQRICVGIGVVVLLTLASAFSVGARSSKLHPVDEGPRDPSFARFRQKLLQAARRGDRRYIWSIVDPKIRWSFGDGGGIASFKQVWAERGPGVLEDELMRVLLLGGQFRGRRTFWAPYVFTAWDESRDAFEYKAIIATNVRVRERPDQGAPVVATLTYDIVKLRNEQPDSRAQASPSAREGWVQIITPAGKTGYVAARYARSPIEHRACFEKKRGKWWMTAFIAGD